MPETNIGDESRCTDLVTEDITKLNAMFAKLTALVYFHLSC